MGPNLVDEHEGVLAGNRYLIIDRDMKSAYSLADMPAAEANDRNPVVRALVRGAAG